MRPARTPPLESLKSKTRGKQVKPHSAPGPVQGLSERGAEGPGAVRIPASAVCGAEGGAPYVWVIDGATMRCARREVRLGTVAGGAIEITEGLNTGEVVAAAGVSQLREGLQVRPLDR